MPMMALAWVLASSGVAASLMPPALPRLPVGAWALTTTGPIRAAISAASAGVLASPPLGTAMPRPAKSGLPACSSKFIGSSRLLSVFLPERPEQVVFRGLVLGDDARDACGVEEMPVVHVLGKTVAAPGAATHRERERQPVVEGAAGGDSVRLVHDHPAHFQLQSETHDVAVIAGVDAHRMAFALIVVDVARDAEGLIEIARLIDRQHRRELLARERAGPADPGLLHHDEAAVPQGIAFESGERGDARRRLRRRGRRELPVRKHHALELQLFLGVEQH